MMNTSDPRDARVATGTEGLDSVLGGGLPDGGFYLLRGDPGVGKTTLALQFLIEGSKRGEQGLYITFAESRGELTSVLRSHGWSPGDLAIRDVGAVADRFELGASQTMFHSSEVELEETTSPMLQEIERVSPVRLAIDSLSEIRLLSGESWRYRRQLLALKRLLAGRRCTTLVTDDRTMNDTNDIIQTLVHGIIVLEKVTPLYGSTRRRVSVEKMRGVKYREGFHDFRIKSGGIQVYPRLVAAEHPRTFGSEAVSSGVPELDSILCGGLERGTSTLLLGAAGTGKSSLGAQYAIASSERGEKAAIYTFEESVGTWKTRSASLGIEVEKYMEEGSLQIKQVDPADLTPGELAHEIKARVEREGVRMIIFDSLNGYLQSVPDERFLLLHLHELLTYLGHQGVTTLLTMTQHGLLGASVTAPVDLSYLADTVMLLRYYENRGEVGRAISVVKKRSGKHERTLREFMVGAGGVRIGKQLKEFQGLLTGSPVYRGGDGAFPSEEHDHGTQ
jgi:circadian clock protein KaiC